ncbi:putative pseudouridine synthase, RluA family [Candidatus Zinderia insecticola CARI]|uniref:Putative pseudouridine synthase, RluA family n=1 Tax=Zinderia insecticola (strain CARI) TaxID=871271 RepID=E0TIV5_ZINIC|nr:putative pseudouridine synthase, RluA family [Candidatus Zinderia insecticola CARI]
MLKVQNFNLYKKIRIKKIFEDKYIIIINKPNYLSVHSGYKIKLNLIEFLKKKYNLKLINLIHRIDKDISGILLLSKSKKILKIINKKFKNKKIKKNYLSIVHGNLNFINKKIKLFFKKNNNFINKKNYINRNGKKTYSIISLIKIYKNFSLINIKLITGKMHQIRMHLNFLGFPIIFDKKYGNKKLDKKIYNKYKIKNKKIYLSSNNINFFYIFYKKIINININICNKYFFFINNLFFRNGV